MEAHQLSFGESSAPNCVEHFDSQQRIVVHEGEALDFLKTLPSESIALVITSPPYNLGKEYERRKDVLSYLQEQEAVIDEAYINITRERIRAFFEGRLPLRPLGRELYQPTGKVARVPIEWEQEHVTSSSSPVPLDILSTL